VAQALRSGFSTGQEALRMAARKFGPEERDLDDGDSMAQIQELQEQLNRLHRQSSTAGGNGAAAGRFASADIIAQFASHDGVRPLVTQTLLSRTRPCLRVYCKTAKPLAHRWSPFAPPPTTEAPMMMIDGCYSQNGRGPKPKCSR
jgi:hypothetical protein